MPGTKLPVELESEVNASQDQDITSLQQLLKTVPISYMKKLQVFFRNGLEFQLLSFPKHFDG